uniref:C3H1-type domain-containing protein n=1 Tax=Heterorhabditis bacteriophora TaxID=37862 RepID=A0A1I7WRL5_HETBA
MIIEVRDDLGGGAGIFSRKHPLSCWLSSMLMCFADSFLANFLLGEPVIAPFKRHDDIILATILWYLVFYAPFDGIYKISKMLPIKCILSVLKEVKRAYKVSHGVSHAAKLYPNSYLVQILVGTAKGAGSGILKTVEQLVRGVWLPNHNEVLRPSFSTKACLVASVVFSLEKNSIYISAPHDIVYLVGIIFFLFSYLVQPCYIYTYIYIYMSFAGFPHHPVPYDLRERLCEQFSNHGFCDKQSRGQCFLLHDVDFSLDLEYKKIEKERRKRKKRFNCFKPDTVLVKEQLEEEEREVKKQRISVDDLKDKARISVSGCHRAGVDAFMTGYAVLFQSRMSLCRQGTLNPKVTIY